MARRLRGVVANIVAGSPVWSPAGRPRILRRLGVSIGAGSRIYPRLQFIGRTDQLQVGRDCFINTELLIGSNAPVVIGDRVSIGPRVQLIPTTHEFGPSRARAGARVSSPIHIGAGCWIGAGVTVLGGVNIGGGTVIAAGAVVTKDCQGDSLYAGTPARFVRSLESPPDHEVLGHEVLGHEVLGHEVLGHEVLEHEELGHESAVSEGKPSDEAAA